MISIEHVEFTYSDGTKALENICVEFPEDTISAILGESGSGKTTLLMCLSQFSKPQKGNINYQGRSIYDIPEKEFRQIMGVVFQKLYLFPHFTVLQNMLLAPRLAYRRDYKVIRDEAQTILERLGISEIAESYPSQISGGQAQRAAIARALLLKPKYMLLDEPTSALDANTTDEFADWLLHLKDQTNFIIVTHDILFARKVACQGVYLSEGKVQDAGDIENIITHVKAGELQEV